MQKLKQGEFAYLTDNVLKKLRQNRILSILEFLQEDVEKLSTITKLNISQIIATRSEIFSKYSAPLINGTCLSVKTLLNKKVVITGIESLDAILGGGMPIGFITELCGLADSGKTQLCFQIAINCVKTIDNTILYIDTKGDFSAVRIQKILNEHKYSHKDMAQIMFKIRVVHAWTLEEVINLLKSLKNKTLVINNLSLIIIDSLPSLMFQYLGDSCKVGSIVFCSKMDLFQWDGIDKELRQLLKKILFYLIGLSYLNTMVNYARYLCRELQLCMICVNIQTRWVYQDDPEDDGEQSVFKECYVERKNRCLGKYWQQIPALVLQLEKFPEKESQSKHVCMLINVSVLRSNSMKYDNNQCILNLSSLGVT